jgi:hypothetical protein
VFRTEVGSKRLPHLPSVDVWVDSHLESFVMAGAQAPDKLCPSCGCASPGSAQRCVCGYQFAAVGGACFQAPGAPNSVVPPPVVGQSLPSPGVGPSPIRHRPPTIRHPVTPGVAAVLGTLAILCVLSLPAPYCDRREAQLSGAGQESYGAPKSVSSAQYKTALHRWNGEAEEGEVIYFVPGAGPAKGVMSILFTVAREDAERPEIWWVRYPDGSEEEKSLPGVAASTPDLYIVY